MRRLPGAVIRRLRTKRLLTRRLGLPVESLESVRMR